MTATAEQIREFLATDFTQADMELISAGNKASKIRTVITDRHLRPGGTVSGPTMMAAADFALYVAILAEIGIVPLALTTSLNTNFLRRPAPNCNLVAECKLLKVGRTLAMGEVSLYSEGHPEVVAHATGTYSIPPEQ